MYVLYRVDGGATSNVAVNTITEKKSIKTCTPNTNPAALAQILNTLRVYNTIPSVSGKDAPTVDELRAMVKYNSGAQRRCITVKDYHDRVMKMPARYGCPFRVSTIEANNKVMMYLLGTIMITI